MKKIQVTVDEDGNISIDMDGFQGETCAAELNKMLSALSESGVKVKKVAEKRKLTSSASVTARQSVSN